MQFLFDLTDSTGVQIFARALFWCLVVFGTGIWLDGFRFFPSLVDVNVWSAFKPMLRRQLIYLLPLSTTVALFWTAGYSLATHFR